LSRWYLDTSAALKLVLDEVESSALVQAVDDAQPELVACWLLETELRRAAQRTPELSQELASELLETVSLFEVPGSLFREAGMLPGTHLRSLDALHLAAAVRIGVERLVTYDVRMTESARLLGLSVLAPA
jgi:predicted nucleic acid-binding protein